MSNGLLEGYIIGETLRRNANHAKAEDVIRQWEIYSEGLKQELCHAKLKLENANSRATIYEEQIEEIKSLARNLAAQVDDRGALLKKQSIEIQILCASEKNKESLIEAQAKRVDFLEKEVSELTRASKHNSAQACAYEGLFRLFASELLRYTSIEGLSVLNPEFVQKAYERAYAYFLRTGKIDYSPDLNPAEAVTRARPVSRR